MWPVFGFQYYLSLCYSIWPLFSQSLWMSFLLLCVCLQFQSHWQMFLFFFYCILHWLFFLHLCQYTTKTQFFFSLFTPRVYVYFVWLLTVKRSPLFQFISFSVEEQSMIKANYFCFLFSCCIIYCVRFSFSFFVALSVFFSLISYCRPSHIFFSVFFFIFFFPEYFCCWFVSVVDEVFRGVLILFFFFYFWIFLWSVVTFFFFFSESLDRIHTESIIVQVWLPPVPFCF